jgi:peptidoglycan/xylan/chitin deacetylase (PgdA/CDA1 family)
MADVQAQGKAVPRKAIAPSFDARVAQRILTLCFHGVGSPKRQLETDEEQFWLESGQFAEILETIRSHERPVDLTFDDSNESDVIEVLPKLMSAGLIAQFFVIAGRVDSAGSLSSQQVQQLHNSGMVIGSHGMWHRPWRQVVSKQVMHEELITSAQHLAEIVGGGPVDRAACPRGSYDRRVLYALRESGYTRVYTVDGGTSRPTAWLRSRHTVVSSDSPSTIRGLLDAPDGSVRKRAVRKVKTSIKRWR